MLEPLIEITVARRLKVDAVQVNAVMFILARKFNLAAAPAAETSGR